MFRQGRRISIAEWLHQIVVIPACFETLAFDTGLAGVVMISGY